MESNQPGQIVFTASNKRRVTKVCKQITPHNEDNESYRFFLCGDSMYGSSLMDGKIKVLKMDTEGQCSERHYMETTWGVSAINFFKF